MPTKAPYQILDSGTLKESVNTVMTKAIGTLFHELETQWEKTLLRIQKKCFFF